MLRYGRWLALLACLPLTGCFNGLLLTPTCVNEPVEETVITPAVGYFCRDRIAIIDVNGAIMNMRSSSLFGSSDNPMSTFRERLDRAAKDCRVKAVVVRINSPGGAVTASDIMYRDLKQFREKTGKPVVACMMDVAASGGYYIAMACDCVYAHPTTVTGSIGVIMSLYNASGLAAKIGIISNAIKSGPIKDIGNPLRDMTEPERAVLQSLVDDFYNQFVRVVSEGRRMPEDRVRQLADGRVYSGIQAQQLGLVDELGYLEDAIARAKDLAHVSDAAVVAYDHGGGYRGSVYAGMPNIPSQINIRFDIPGLTGGQGASFMYMWEPGTPR